MTLFANNVAGTMAANIGPTDTQILLGAGQGALFPAPGVGEYFYVTVVHITSGLVEVMQCTARSVDTLTVVRGRDSTAAIAFTTGSVVEMRLAAIMLREVDYRTVKGVANGLASLDSAGDVPDAQISALILRAATAAATYVPLTQRAAANGVATLDAGTKIPAAQIPDLSATYLTKTNPAVTGTLTTTSTITAAAAITSSQNFVGAGVNVVLATTGAGACFLRPNGAASATGQMTLTSSGVATAVNFQGTSDRRLKKNIRKHVTPAGFADQITLHDWDWRKAQLGSGTGPIAQHVQKFAAHHVQGDKILSIDKAGLALEGVVDLAARVRQLEKKIHARRPNH